MSPVSGFRFRGTPKGDYRSALLYGIRRSLHRTRSISYARNLHTEGKIDLRIKSGPDRLRLRQERAVPFDRRRSPEAYFGFPLLRLSLLLPARSFFITEAFRIASRVIFFLAPKPQMTNRSSWGFSHPYTATSSEGTQALAEFLLRLHLEPERARGYQIFVYPIVNPTGFEDGTPKTRRGHDLAAENCGMAQGSPRPITSNASWASCNSTASSICVPSADTNGIH